SALGKNLPASTEPIGESWELSDHPDGKSQFDPHEVELRGMEFGQLIREFPVEMIGRERAPKRYPLPLKIIDAQKDLSVQVHPDDEWCRSFHLNDRGKCECWYIMDCKPGAKMIYGLAENTTDSK